MINTTVENVIKYEIYGVGTENVLFETESRLRAYEYYYKVSRIYGSLFAIRKVTVNTEIEILEGDK